MYKFEKYCFIGDWAQNPIPQTQTPQPKTQKKKKFKN